MKKTDILSSLRKKIDLLDKKISVLLRKRLTLTQKIGLYKKKNKGQITNKKRELKILKRLKTKYEKEIFKKIIQESKNEQKELRSFDQKPKI